MLQGGDMIYMFAAYVWRTVLLTCAATRKLICNAPARSLYRASVTAAVAMQDDAFAKALKAEAEARQQMAKWLRGRQEYPIILTYPGTPASHQYDHYHQNVQNQFFQGSPR